jgi:CheY-like chemotaxis protein
MTAVDSQMVRGEALTAGCVAYLLKPFAALQLLDAIDRAAP